jgi:hypothetical protein
VPSYLHKDPELLVTTHRQPTSLPEAPFWKIATDKEMTSIEELNVMAYGQPPMGAAIIGSMFVYEIKMNPDGTIEKFKVRLVALSNHQKYGETFSETYAPGTQLSSSRLILYMALKMNLELKHMDVRTAYLQSKLTGDHDDIWVRLPSGFASQQVGTCTASSYDHSTACNKLDVSGTLPIVTSSSNRTLAGSSLLSRPSCT